MSTAHPHAHNPHATHGDEPHSGHPAHLAHHFDTPEQQFASGKLGMWAFLATELLMFGGLFCAYAVYRANHPDVFLFAHLYLDKILGGINTAVLIASSFTMAWGVRAAQLGQQSLLRILLALTFLGGVGFMGIKAIEYKAKWEHYIFAGRYNAFNPAYAGPARAPGTSKPSAEAAQRAALDYWAHHAHEGTQKSAGHETNPHTGQMGGSQTDPRAGHGEGSAQPAPGHDSVSKGYPSPAKIPGGAMNSEVQHPGHIDESTTLMPTTAPTTRRGPVSLVIDPNHGTNDQAKIFPTFNQPVGITPGTEHASHHVAYESLDTLSRQRVNTFFGIYFIMTGLHGIHVLVGMAIIGWLFFTAGRYNPEYYAPVDIGGLYWHLVDLIWIFLFPLLYLIH